MDSGTLITIIVVVVLVLIALGLVLFLRRNRTRTRKPNSHRATGPREKAEGDARVRRADAADPSARYGRHDIRATEHTTEHTTEQPGVIQDRDDEVDDAEPQQT
jgi:hypothetical protein